MTRKVQVNMVMVGNTKHLKSDNVTNDQMLERVCETVRFHFGERPLYVADVSMYVHYPEYFASCWLVGDPVSGGMCSELMVIAHGKSMKMAKDNIFNAVKKIDWDRLASDVY